MIFEMMSRLEMYIMYCIIIMERIMYRLRLTIRFTDIAKAHWHGCMFDQFHQRDHSKRTSPTARVARVSISGLINVQDTFVTEFHKLKTVYKGVFNNLNRQET
jgi:hypothetical protein